MSTLAERLRAALDARGRSAQWLEGEPAKLSRGYGSLILNAHRTNVGSSVLERIATALDVDFTWLATGRGAMGTPAEKAPVPEGDEPSLAETVAIYAGRWAPATVRAAEGAVFYRGKPEQGWKAILDDLQEIITGVRPKGDLRAAKKTEKRGKNRK